MTTENKIFISNYLQAVSTHGGPCLSCKKWIATLPARHEFDEFILHGYLCEPCNKLLECKPARMELLSLYRQEGADAKALLTHAVFWMFQGCGNSDANAYLTEWLEQAKKLGAYNGKTVGKIIDLRDEFNEWLDENGGLPPLDNQQGGAVSAELALLKRKVDYWERRCKAAELFMASHVADPDITSEMARNYREWLHIAQEDQPSIKAHNE